MTEERIRAIHRDIVLDDTQFYRGPTAIRQEWQRRFADPAPPLRTIGQMLADLGLSEKRRRGRTQGAAAYLCYPEHTIYSLLGRRVLESDFIGKKYIAGHTRPLNFIGFSFKKAPRLRYFTRVEGQTTAQFIQACGDFFSRFEIPDHIKLDNALAVIGSASGKRNISRTMAFLLGRQVVPIFAVPRKPFSQASIEGNNSVFSRTFWNRRRFTSLDDVDRMLGWFNAASQRYTEYHAPVVRPPVPFTPKVYFIRQVRQDRETGSGMIDVLNDVVMLPSSYVHYFVLAEWNLTTEKLTVFFERELQPHMIERSDFMINKQSKIHLKGW